MRCELGACFIAVALLASACDEKKSVETDLPQTATSASATTAPPAQTAAQPAAVMQEPATDNFATFADSDWCPRAHDDTVKIVEGMKQTMKLAGKEGENDEFAPPERARFLELCGKLPFEMQQCLVIGWAARNREACQTALDGLDSDAKAAYSELMGK